VILPEHASAEGLGNPVPVLGTTRQLAEVINHTRLDRIIVVKGCISDQEVDECGAISQRMGVVLSHAIGPVSLQVRVRVAHLCGMPLVDLRPVAFTRRQEIVKRGFDIIVSAVALMFLSPVALVVAAVIKLTSEGPVLFKSPRVGRGGRYFTFLKFRSMYTNPNGRQALAAVNEKTGHIFKVRNDPRITPFGRLMRKYSIDELAQLINVLRGDMSLVGPRPLPAEDLDPDGQSREFAFWSEQRSRVLPGITGLWQIRGRSDIAFEEMIDLDVEYIRNWSFSLDLRILLETPLVVLTAKGAY
jgi:exopolysaccharide biosynthesis polyprenyl glycosylphosphotransferase